MHRLLVLVVLAAGVATHARGQTYPGQFPANTIWGNSTGAPATPVPGKVTNNQLNNMAAGTIKCNSSSTSGVPQDCNYPIFNVADPQYGALCNGVNNDTTAIQNAINAAQSASGGTVVLPRGQCTINGDLTISAGGVNLVGQGRNATFLTTTSTTLDVITINGSAFDASVSHLSISGAGNTTASNGAGISTSNGVGAIMIFDVRIQNTYNGIVSSNPGVTGVLKVLQTDISSVANDGILINGISQLVLTDITMFQPGGHAGGAGYHFKSGGGFYLTNCQAGQFGRGMLIDPTTGNSVFDVFINLFEADSTVGPGIVFDTTGGGSIYEVLADTVRSGFSNPGEGILFTGSNTSNISLTNYATQRNSTNGVTVTNLKNSIISGGQVTGNAGSGISIAGGDGLVISENSIGSDPGGGSTQVQGINITNAFSGHLTVRNNNLYSNTTNLVNSSTSTNVNIADNIGYNPVGKVTPSVGSSPWTFTNGATPGVAYIWSGTISALSVDGTAIAVNTQNVIPLGAGQTLVVTYSSTPNFFVDVK